jgi:hypothetical protein
MTQTEPNFVALVVSRLFTAPVVAAHDGRARQIIRGWVNRHRDRAKQAASGATRRFDVPLATSFSGPIAEIPLSELLQTIATSGKDSVVTVRHEARESRIWCLKGEIIDAECGRLAGDLAFYRIAALEQGLVLGHFRAMPRLRTIRGSTQALLLEAALRKDQCNLLKERIGDTRAVYSPTTKALVEARQGRSALAVLRAFYPGATLDEVLSDVHLGDLEALRIVAGLVEEGWLAPNQELTAKLVTPPRAKALPEGPRVTTRSPHFAGNRAPDRAPSSSQGILMVGSAFALAIMVGLAWAWAPVPDQSRSHAPSESLPTPPAPALGSPSDDGAKHANTQAAEEGPASAAELRVDVEATPKDATLSLDGGPAATGRLALRLARDGQTHELRVAAAGYETARFLFSGAPPPGLIELVATADSLPTAPEPTAAARRRLPALRRVATQAKSAPAPTAADVLESEPTQRSSEIEREWPVENRRVPRVKIVPNEDPTVLVLE